MINVLRSDLYKLSKSRTFYICLSLLIVFTIVAPFSIEALQNMMKQIPMNEMAIVEQATEAGMQGMSVGISSNTLLSEEPLTGQGYLGNLFSGNVILLCITIFISIFVTSEFSQGTIKNIASRGISRTKLYLSKVITVAIMVLVFCLVAIVIGILISTLLWGFGPVNATVIGQCLRLIGLQLLLHLAFACFCVMICVVMKNNGAAISINLCAMMFIPSIITLIDKLTKNQFHLANGWPSTYINSLITLTPQTGVMLRAILVAVIYVVVTTILGVWVFKKKDIA